MSYDRFSAGGLTRELGAGLTDLLGGYLDSKIAERRMKQREDLSARLTTDRRKYTEDQRLEKEKREAASAEQLAGIQGTDFEPLRGLTAADTRTVLRSEKAEKDKLYNESRKIATDDMVNQGYTKKQAAQNWDNPDNSNLVKKGLTPELKRIKSAQVKYSKNELEDYQLSPFSEAAQAIILGKPYNKEIHNLFEEQALTQVKKNSAYSALPRVIQRFQAKKLAWSFAKKNGYDRPKPVKPTKEAVQQELLQQKQQKQAQQRQLMEQQRQQRLQQQQQQQQQQQRQAYPPNVYPFLGNL